MAFGFDKTKQDAILDFNARTHSLFLGNEADYQESRREMTQAIILIVSLFP